MKKIIFRFFLGIILLVIGLIAYWLITGLPVASGYAAKNVCSCLFVTQRPEASILQEDVDKIVVRNAVNRIDYEQKRVTSTVWGFAKQTAVYRKDEGCVLLEEASSPFQLVPKFHISPTPDPDTISWPMGNLVSDTLFPEINYAKLDQALKQLLTPLKGSETVVPGPG